MLPMLLSHLHSLLCLVSFGGDPCKRDDLFEVLHLIIWAVWLLFVPLRQKGRRWV
ncbi:hypothetical protein BDV40DRAFT_259707 [Aspergillus tamarii]|uniref:Uncharacterized protein n=1 Tax=Aspergillus tamarii TaxID=41984 RepID=A0A5N6V1H3_ASPTM|nr:hypothetical protein BDV40DRAFT_259707 [Aspergillus tamarii]